MVWSHIKPGDTEAYRKFHNFLLKCENITQMQTWNVLGTLEIMWMLLSTFQSGTRDKWSSRVLPIRKKQVKELELADFIDFANDENLITQYSLKRLWNRTLTRKRNQEGLQHMHQDQRKKNVDLAVRSPCINCRKSSIG